MTALERAAGAFEVLAAGKSPTERQRVARDVMAVLLAAEVRR